MWRTDGRLYPPQEDRRYAVPGRPDLRRYRSVKRSIYAGENGALQIEDMAVGLVVLDKPGADGGRIER